LRVFRDPVVLDRVFAAADRFLSRDLSFRRLSRGEMVELEPALAPIARQLTGAIQYASDEVGDAYRFCSALADCARLQGVVISLRHRSLLAGRARGPGSRCGERPERFEADKLHRGRRQLQHPATAPPRHSSTRTAGKGYSVTCDAHQGPRSLRFPIVDDDLHAAIVAARRRHSRCRNRGVCSYDRTRILIVLTICWRYCGGSFQRNDFDPASAKPWCGLRPCRGRRASSSV